MMMDELQILQNARATIAQGWCSGMRGMSEEGDFVWGFDDRAVAWCALGALDRALGVMECYALAIGRQCVERLSQQLPKDWMQESAASWDYSMIRVASWNNTKGQAKTLEMFDQAIAAVIAERAIKEASKAKKDSSRQLVAA
jgi:hypothetical protein